MPWTEEIVEGTPFQLALGFEARSVVVANVSSSWARIPQAEYYVPPWTYGVVLPFTAASPNAVVQWTTPRGIVEPIGGAGSIQATWVEQPLPFNPGTLLSQTAPTPGTGQAPTQITTPTVGTAAQLDASLAAGASTTILAAGSMKVGIVGGFLTVDDIPITTSSPGTPVLVTTDTAAVATYAVSSFRSLAFAIVPGIGIGMGDGGIKVTNGGTATAFWRGTITWR